MLEMIRDYCTNITTLETLLYTSAEMESRLDAADSPRAADEALTLVDVRFKAIPSLKEVIVNLYDEPPSDYLRKKIHKCGWTIKVTAMEESDGVGFSDDDDDYMDFEDWIEMNRLEDSEERAWEGELGRRRNDPFWKNDPDHD
jgi:hypothetical protein